MSKAEYDPDWIPPPGATIEDLLSRKASARPRQVIIERFGRGMAQQLFDGKLGIDSDVAAFLAHAVGLSKSFWLEREKLYREALDHRQREQQLLAQLPLDEMKSRAFIQPVQSHAETVDEVVKFFGKDDPESCHEHIEQLPRTIKQKTSRAITSHPGSLAVWIRAGEIEADQIECAAWNPERLQNLMPELRRLTRTEDPAQYLPELKRLCQSCGIALAVVRPPHGCSARGAVRFLSTAKAMLLLSYRHLSNDQFWFSFFHELAHLLLHSRGSIIVDDWEDSETKEEHEADQYAAQILIPSEFQTWLTSLRDERSIISFARRIGVSRGIVVGQMQHKRIVEYQKFNRLKIYYQWNSHNEIELKEG
ncbi:ImmA/IrrE family metallo-endopeptidase [Sorangium sp. So ce281]|uniref:ImmA/IrrE family metallo-endopeptidase n=1 Tax=unclassified Sorangium TaxID=2621164 RepID=UPI003F61326F